MHIPVEEKGCVCSKDVHFLPNKTTPTFKSIEGKCQSLRSWIFVELHLGFIPGCCVFFVVFLHIKIPNLIV